jgi:hypothetical protein
MPLNNEPLTTIYIPFPKTLYFCKQIKTQKNHYRMKNVIFVLVIGALIAAGNCGLTSCGSKSAGNDTLRITVTNFMDSAGKWEGKDVLISGTVSHVCRHSGKKLFLFGDNPDKTVKVNAGKTLSGFDIKLEGSDAQVFGTVVEDEKIDANYLNEWEADIKKMVDDGEIKVCNAESKAITGQTSDSVKTGESVEDPYADVKEFRKKLEASGKTYISIYAIDCKTIKEIKK